MTGIVKGYEIKKNRDGQYKVLMLNCEISGPDDVQSIEYMSHAGDDHIPEVGSTVTILNAGKSWKIAIASADSQDFDGTLNEGERKLFSIGGAYIKLDDSGNIELNGSADSSVAYTDLNAALQSFIVDLNAKLVTALTAAGSSWPGTSIDISGSKVEEVKLP